MQKADYWLRLMKQRTDALVAKDEKLQQFLMWVSEKSLLVKVPYKLAAVRAFYLDRALDRALYDTFNRTFPLTLDFARALDPELKEALQQLKDQLPDPDREEERLKVWWQANGQVWTEQLRAAMIVYRNIGHDWQFSWQFSHPHFPLHQYIEVLKQRKLLQQYYEANQLLVNCLNSDCNVTPAVRSHIEETLLLPIAEIERRGSC